MLILPETCTAVEISALWRESLPAVSLLGATDALVLDAAGEKKCDGSGEALIVEIYRRSARQGFALTCRDGNGMVIVTLAKV